MASAVETELSPLESSLPAGGAAEPALENQTQPYAQGDAVEPLNHELELRVQERTLDLEAANLALRTEIAHRERAEESLQRSGRLLSLLLNGIGDGLALVDQNGVILMANEMLAKLYRLPLNALIDRSWFTLCPATTPLLTQALAEATMVDGREQIRHDDGGLIVIDVQILPLVDPDGRAEQAVLHLVDVTRRLQLETLVMQNERLAAHGRLAAVIAHEVNTPLQSIQNFIFLAASDDLAERTLNLQLVSSEIDRISTLLQRLLEVSRSGEGDRALSLLDGQRRGAPATT